MSSAVWWRPVSQSRCSFHDEVEAGVEGELLEEVVVDLGAGLDSDATRAVEVEPDPDRRLGRCAHTPRAPPQPPRLSCEE